MARFKVGDLVKTYDKQLGVIVQKRHKKKGRPTGLRVQFTKPFVAKAGVAYGSGWYGLGDVELADPIDALAGLAP